MGAWKILWMYSIGALVLPILPGSAASDEHVARKVINNLRILSAKDVPSDMLDQPVVLDARRTGLRVGMDPVRFAEKLLIKKGKSVLSAALGDGSIHELPVGPEESIQVQIGKVEFENNKLHLTGKVVGDDLSLLVLTISGSGIRGDLVIPGQGTFVLRSDKQAVYIIPADDLSWEFGNQG